MAEANPIVPHRTDAPLTKQKSNFIKNDKTVAENLEKYLLNPSCIAIDKIDNLLFSLDNDALFTATPKAGDMVGKPVLCRFGGECSRMDCWFWHPGDDTDADTPNQTKPKKTLRVSQLSQAKRKECLLYGYIRENYDSFVPTDIMNEFINRFVTLSDEFDTTHSTAKQYSIDPMVTDGQQMRTISGTSTAAYGTDIITDGSVKTWRMEMVALSGTYTTYGALIGIVEKSERVDSYFWQQKRAYAMHGEYGLYNGKDSRATYNGERPILQSGDIVSMTLDLTQKVGTLRFVINETDFGIAFENIEVSGEYVLGVAVWGNEVIKLIE